MGAGVVGTIFRQQDVDDSGTSAPIQSEPETMADDGTEWEPLPTNGHVKLVAHDDLTPNVEQLDDDLDELEQAEAAASRGDWSTAAAAYLRVTMDPPVPLQAWYHLAIACLKT